jgi:hypothetical protein
MIKKNGLSGSVINRILINHSLGSDERNVFVITAIRYTYLSNT